jgi:hypothetical protein
MRQQPPTVVFLNNMLETIIDLPLMVQYQEWPNGRTQMSVVVDKLVHIADFRAKRLERLSAAGGLTEDELIEEGLDLLFREQDRQATREEVLRESQKALAELEIEIGSMPASNFDKVQLDGAVFVVGTYISEDRICHLEEQS